MYTAEEIIIANKTCRSKGTSVFDKNGNVRSVVANYVNANVSKHSSVLDFGSGKEAVQTKWLRDNGFKNVTAYDFGVNCIEGLHDKNALNKKYDCVFASNVINVSINKEMLINTLMEIKNCMRDDGTAYFNYPSSPRKAGLSTDDVRSFVKNVFGGCVQVAGTKNEPIWMVKLYS